MTSALLGPHYINAQLGNLNNPVTPKIGLKIASLKANQTVPIGQLTIYGISSDTPETNCKVFVDWNDTKPMQNVTGIGPGGLDDYSKWTFTYSQRYHLISEGTNELTKISCYSNLTNNVTTKFYSVSITGSNNITNSNIPGAYASHMLQPFHNINNSSSKAGEAKSNVYVEIRGKYSGNKNNNGDNKIIKFKTSSSMISSKDNKTQDGQNNFDDNHQDLNNVIRDLIKERLNRISNQFVR